jgi:Na+-transporting methylmalonyl-CoA/oxaloacetate decarboxylase gamma subunit
MFAAPHKRTGTNAMLTRTTLEVVALLALLAVVHAVVSTFIARQLVRKEQASAETRNNVISGNFARASANDQLRKAA